MKPTMANKLRAQITGRSLVAYLILGALVLVFVLFDFKQGSSGVGSIARVNNAQISVLDYQQEMERVQQYYSSLFGGQMDLGPQRQMLQQQAVENLVHQELVSQAAQSEGILATDAEVRDFVVKDIPIFQENGAFQRERYMRFLEYQHMNPAEFENKIRKDIAMTRSRRFFETVAQPNSTEIEKMKELKGHKLNVNFAKINPNDLAGKIKSTPAEVSAALADPEFMKKVDAEFKATKSDYDQRDEVKAQHILLLVKDPSQDQSVLAKIKAIKERLKKEDFGKVAAQTSEDPGSKIKNGDLGYFTKGRMVKEFDEAAFSLPVGQVSEPIKTQYGYHLIKVTDHKKPKEATLDSFKDKVAEKLLARQKVEKTLADLDRELKEGNEAAVNASIKGLGLTWDETGLFDLASETVPKLSGSAISGAIFEVSKAHPLLNHLVREGADQYVVRFKDSQVTDGTLEAQAQEVMTKKRSNQNYESWINNYRKSAKVTINNRILTN